MAHGLPIDTPDRSPDGVFGPCRRNHQGRPAEILIHLLFALQILANPEMKSPTPLNNGTPIPALSPRSECVEHAAYMVIVSWSALRAHLIGIIDQLATGLDDNP
jgi:hypothetical protein